jgi:NAD-dependent DNA ligase
MATKKTVVKKAAAAKAKTPAAKKPPAKKPAAKTPAAKKPAAKAAMAMPEPKARTSSRLSVHGKTVVLTGTVPGMERKDAEKRLAGLGAKCTSSVSAKTDYLFAMDDAGGSKLADAERHNVTVLGDVALFSLIGRPDLPPKALPRPISEEAIEKVAERKPDSDEGFAGKTCVITGTLSLERADIAKLLEAAGAKVTGSVSANTHYLITGAGVGAAKTSKASALGVTVIDETTMHRMLGS